MNAQAWWDGPDVLGVLLTSKCNVNCRHCCNDSGPAHAGALAFEDISRCIEMAREIPSIREIGFSGGEPFLFLPLLNRAIKFAVGEGFTTSVTTNGFWAKSPSAGRLLDDLLTSGLGAIHISTSAFHQEFIGHKTVVRAAEASVEKGLKVTVNLVSTPSFGIEHLREAFGSLLGQVRVVVMPCLPAGRGVSAVNKAEFVHDQTVPSGNCREHFKKLAVDRQGNVYPCCSPGGFSPPLRMGSIQDKPLREIWEASADNKLLAILESVGPQFFLPFLRAAALDPPVPDHFSDQCHLCQVMLNSKNYQEAIRDAANQLFAELMSLPEGHGEPTGDRLSNIVQHQLPHPHSMTANLGV